MFVNLFCSSHLCPSPISTSQDFSCILLHCPAAQWFSSLNHSFGTVLFSLSCLWTIIDLLAVLHSNGMAKVSLILSIYNVMLSLVCQTLYIFSRVSSAVHLSIDNLTNIYRCKIRRIVAKDIRSSQPICGKSAIRHKLYSDEEGFLQQEGEN